MDAIKAATSLAADCLGISGRTGSIKRGYDADIVVVDEDPLHDIEVLKRAVLVINDGRISVNRLGR